MFFLLLLLPLALAERRLGADPCAHQAYVLAQGAPLPRGRVFPDQRAYVDARVDATGVGTR